MSPHSPNGAAPDPFHAHDHAHCSETVLRRAEEQARAAILGEPNVRALLDQFPDATLETVNQKEA